MRHFPRMPIEEESPEQLGYDRVKFNLTGQIVGARRPHTLGELGVDLASPDPLLLPTIWGCTRASRELIAARRRRRGSRTRTIYW